MAGKRNEAYVEFKANTSEFQKSIKQMNAELKTATNELRLNATQLKGTGDNVDLLSDRQSILQKELAASTQKVELTEKILAECKETLGENSKEYQTLNNAVLAAKNQQAAIQNELDQTTDKLEKITTENKEAATSFGQLSDKIEAQENDLAALKKEYANVVLEQGKGSREAKELAHQIDELSTELGENKKKLNDAENAAEKLDKSLDDLDKSAKNAGDGFTVMKGALGNLVSDGIQAAASAMGDFVKSTIDTGVDFSSTMSSVQAISGATGDDLKALTDKAMELGASTVFSAGEVGDAMVEMAKAGWSTEQIIDGMAGVLNASSASGEGLAEVATIAADAISGFGMKASDSVRVADLLTQAANAGTIGIDDLGETFKYVAPVAGSMGLNIEDVTTAVTAMSMAGIKGSQAGTSLRTMLTNLVKPTKNMAAAMEELDIEVANADGTMKPLDEIISNLRSSFDGLTEEQKTYYAATLAGKEGMSGMLSLMNLTQEEYDAIAESMYNAKGVAEETSSVMLDNLGGDLEELGGNLETLKLELFDTFEGAMRDGVGVLNSLVDGIRSATKWITEHKAVVATVAAIIGVLTTAITAYNVVQGIKTAMDAANVTTVWALVAAHIAQAAAAMAAIAPYVLIVAAIAAVIAIIVLCVKHWDKIKEKITEVAKKVKEKATEIKDNITKKLGEAKDKAVQIFENIKKSITDKITAAKNKVTEIFNNIKNAITEKITNAKNSAVNTFQNMVSGITSKVEAVKSKVTSVFNAVKTAITKPVEAARKTVAGIVDKIKGAFNFKWSLPKLKIPKITVTGGKPPYGIAGKGSLPKFSIKWNAKGAVFTKPTVFQGFGEAGTEYALPLNERSLAPLATMLNKLTVSGDNGLGDMLASRFDNAVDRLAARLEKLEANFYVDGERFATATAGYNDAASGTRAQLTGRGLAVK